MDAILALNCPPIWIKTISMNQCWPDCPPKKYCYNGGCVDCSACGDPYIMAEQGETELVIIAECIDKGSCPASCFANLWPKGNATLCSCVDVIPPTPTVPPTIVCKVGCTHGGCNTTGECNCVDGWSGALCDECVPDPGCQHGHCNETERCICNQDWGGVNCDQDVSYCGMNQPCLNEGQCENNGNGGYTCTCAEGFTGAICENETSLHHCQRVCPINGTCLETDSAGVYQCHCQDGYAGDDCTQPIARSSGNYLIFLALPCAILLVVAVLCIFFVWNKLRIHGKSEGIPGSSSNSGMPLITDTISHRLEGTTVFLTIKPSWKPCFLKTCKCLMEAPFRISEDSETEVSVRSLNEGFKYNFEIYKYKRTSFDVEDSECSVAECEVSVVFSTSGNGEDSCSETIGNALCDVATKKALNRPLEADRRLRERVAGFFDMTSDHQKSFLGGQTPTYLHIDILQEVLESYEFVNKRIGDLLSHLAEESCGKTEDFVEILTKFHPNCQSCARLWHQTHGGTTVFTHAACNGVAQNVV